MEQFLQVLVDTYNVMLSTPALYKLESISSLSFSSSECHILSLDQNCMHKLIRDGGSNSDACKTNVLSSSWLYLSVRHNKIYQNKGGNSIRRNFFFLCPCGCLEQILYSYYFKNWHLLTKPQSVHWEFAFKVYFLKFWPYNILHG